MICEWSSHDPLLGAGKATRSSLGLRKHARSRPTDGQSRPFLTCASAPICYRSCPCYNYVHERWRNFEQPRNTAVEFRSSAAENITFHGHEMPRSWILRLLNLLSILAFLCILSSTSPTSFPLTKGTTNHELGLDARSRLRQTPPVLPGTHAISQRSPANIISYNVWGNGWTSRSEIYVRTPPSTTSHPEKRH